MNLVYLQEKKKQSAQELKQMQENLESLHNRIKEVQCSFLF